MNIYFILNILFYFIIRWDMKIRNVDDIIRVGQGRRIVVREGSLDWQ